MIRKTTWRDCSCTTGLAIWSRCTLPLSEVSLEHAAGLPAMSLPGPPSARFLGVDKIPWTMDKPVCDELWPAILVSENDALMGYLGVHSHEDRIRGSILQVEDGEIVPWRERCVHMYSLVLLQ